MIPMADENPVRRIPWCTLALITACVVVYFAVQPGRHISFAWNGIAETVNTQDLRFVVANAAIPCELVKGRPLTEQEFRRTFDDGDTSACTNASGPAHSPGKNVYLAALLTLFLHASIPHLFGNMLFLWVFGNNIEDRKGWEASSCSRFVGGATRIRCPRWSLSTRNSTGVRSLGGRRGSIAAVMGALSRCQHFESPQSSG